MNIWGRSRLKAIINENISTVPLTSELFKFFSLYFYVPFLLNAFITSNSAVFTCSLLKYDFHSADE